MRQADVHQHLWTRSLLDALARRQALPLVRRSGGLTVLHSAGERACVIDVAAEAPERRAALVRADGLDFAVIAISSPIGIESLPRDEALELIDAHLAGVSALGAQFAAWGPVPLDRPQPDDVDDVLACGALGVSVELLRFVGNLAARVDLWKPLVRHTQEARIYEQVWDGPEANAWVICWSREQDTGWHDHDESAAAIAVLVGQVREQRLRLAAAPAARLLSAGSRVFVPASAIHRVDHAGTAPAVSIHAYSPPLRRTGAYTFGPRGELQRGPGYEQELRAA